MSDWYYFIVKEIFLYILDNVYISDNCYKWFWKINNRCLLLKLNGKEGCNVYYRL